MAASVLGEFSRHGFSVDDLGPAERSDLLKRLEVCPGLDDYAIGLFLALLHDDAEKMVACSGYAVDHQAATGYGSIEGLPWAWGCARPVVPSDPGTTTRGSTGSSGSCLTGCVVPMRCRRTIRPR